MDNYSSSSDFCNDSKQSPVQAQSSYSETAEKNISEIEKLYLKIKEDWL